MFPAAKKMDRLVWAVKERPVGNQVLQGTYGRGLSGEFN
jgi:hypothetical protein